MNSPPFQEDEIPLQVSGQARLALLRAPRRLAPRPALLINLAMDRRTSLDGEGFDTVAAIFLAAGHRVASFDLPYHGDLAGPGMEGLTGMAAAVARGEDVFADPRAVGAALIDHCTARDLAAPGRIVVSGTSRGGLAALHLMAGDERILAGAIHAALLHIPAVTEFAHLADHPIVQRANVRALVPRLADRPLFIAIGTEDPRVGAAHSFELYACLLAGSRVTPPTLFCAPGESHGPTYPNEAGYQAGAAFLLQQCAWASKDAAIEQ